jgi:predicted DNA-binding antitoxin AbrB/MazE fold protein
MTMILTVEAVYENGVLKPKEPLPLTEHEQVQITVQSRSSSLADLYGIMRWAGDHDTLERIALDSEFLLEESP